MASKFWSVVIILLVLVSFSKSRAVPEDNLSEIDKDLASILSQAADTSENDADNKIVVNYGKIYKSVLSGFVPEGESTKDTKRAETDKALEEDDMESTFKELLDHLSSQEENSSPMDAADRFGSKFPQDNDDEADKIPIELLEDLKSGPGPQDNSDSIPRELMDKYEQDAADDKKEKLAKLLLDVIDRRERQKHLNDDGHNEDGHKDDGHEDEGQKEDLKQLLDSLASEPKEDDEPMTRELLNDLESRKKERVRDPGFDNSDDSIPKDLLDDLKQDASRENAARDTDCGLECKKKALREILMDELVSRMTSIAKRGDKIPRRMLDIWKKYKTKRDNKSNLMM